MEGVAARQRAQVITVLKVVQANVTSHAIAAIFSALILEKRLSKLVNCKFAEHLRGSTAI